MKTEAFGVKWDILVLCLTRQGWVRYKKASYLSPEAFFHMKYQSEVQHRLLDPLILRRA